MIRTVTARLLEVSSLITDHLKPLPHKENGAQSSEPRILLFTHARSVGVTAFVHVEIIVANLYIPPLVVPANQTNSL